MSAFNENTVEQATLEWFRSLGYTVLFGGEIAPNEPAAECSDYRDVLHSVDPVAYRDYLTAYLDEQNAETVTEEESL